MLRLRLGREVRLGRLLTLDVWAGARTSLEIADGAIFQTACRVQLHGGSVDVGADVHVRDFVQLKARGGTLRVRHNTVLARDVVVHATEKVDIGSHCGIGERTSIIDSDHTHDGGDEPFLDRPLKTSPVVVGRNVLVSANCLILRGATVGENCVVAASSVVPTGRHPAGHLLAGAPASPVRPLGGQERPPQK